MLATLILLTTFSVPAYAETWYSEDNGEASLTVEYGWPYMAIAEYSTNTLKLGERCIVYASATAKGSMYVHGYAMTTGWVTGEIYWYTRGHLCAYGLGGFYARITIKFQAIDETAGALVEKVILHKGGKWTDNGTWRWECMDIPLVYSHYYKFVLYAEVHADALGEGAAIADFGGVWLEDSEIVWGYISVPHTNPHPPKTLSISVPYGHGTTNPSPGIYEFEHGTVVTITAIPDQYYNFSYWEIDDGWSTDNPIIVVMDSSHTLRCHFKQAGSGNPPGGGGGHVESKEP